MSDGFKEDVSVLRNYSFISVNADGITFEMHGMVQLATRKWLKAHKQQERWKQQFIRNLDAELPTGEYENWVRCQALFPHAVSSSTAAKGTRLIGRMGFNTVQGSIVHTKNGERRGGRGDVGLGNKCPKEDSWSRSAF